MLSWTLWLLYFVAHAITFVSIGHTTRAVLWSRRRLVFGQCDEPPLSPEELTNLIFFIKLQYNGKHLRYSVCVHLWFLCSGITLEGVNSSEVWDPEHKNDDADGTNQHFGADQKLIIKMVSKIYSWKLVMRICVMFLSPFDTLHYVYFVLH